MLPSSATRQHIPTLVPMIAVPGGPASGASLILRKVRQRLGNMVLIVPEAATQIWSAGLSIGHDGLDVCQDEIWWQCVHNEYEYASMAVRRGRKALVLDRTVLDGGIYVPEGPEAFYAKYGKTGAELARQYASVVYLESIASRYPQLYRRADGNEERLEEAAVDAARVDRLNYENYLRLFPNLILIEATLNFDEKVEKAASIITREVLRLAA